MTTKADRIRQIAQENPDWKTGQIGKACDCRPEYVRVVLRQRVGGGLSENDRRYLSSPLGQEMRRKLAPRKSAYVRARYYSGDRSVARAKAKEAYRKARERGLSTKAASRAAGTAYTNALVTTGQTEHGRSAYAEARASHEASP